MTAFNLTSLSRQYLTVFFWVMVIAVVIISAFGAAKAEDPTSTEKAVPDKSLLVETEWLAEKGNSPKLRIIDFGRKPQDYKTGHIAGAVFVDRKVVRDKVNEIPGMLPPVNTVAAELEKAGISNNNIDDSGGLWASRLFWALEYLGHENVHILNGGWNKWIQEKRPIQVRAFIPPRGNFTVHLHPDLLATKEWILENLPNPRVQIIDTRSFKEYAESGDMAAQNGHIPGAVNINWILNLTPNESETFLPAGELKELYESMNISKNNTIVTSCRIGLRAAHTYFVLRTLGYSKVRVYDGSWIEWVNSFGTTAMTESLN